MSNPTNRALRIADDFGLGRDHDAVILDLLAQGHLDGTSVMVDGMLTDETVARLADLRAQGRQIGLHLNLTHDFGAGQPHMPIGALLRAAVMRRLPTAFHACFARQASTFQARLGHLPDFYDGHQHCHCLPGLREHAATLPRATDTCWLRVPAPQHMTGLALNLRAGGAKVLLLTLLARRAGRYFRCAGWSVNTDFSGYLRLSDPQSVARWLPRLIAAAPPDAVLMLHPGSAHDTAQCPSHAPQSRAIEALLIAEL